MLSLDELQLEQATWSLSNFGPQPKHRSLLGVTEEVGELAHAHLKAEQGIRTNENHEAKKKDAIGDIVIYLADYCTQQGFSFQECVEAAWNEVKQRDWKKNSISG